ncbi:MAG: hypothetical protein JNM40_02750 [Myxococcales bacterium]|nr:hypothetical protein [Myxococcales bacterium]
MQHSILVESRREQWQEATGKVRRARAWDSSQTLVEQAYAAAIAKRWNHINKPDKAFKPKPYWLATGILLDSESERYLLDVTDKRIAWMQNTMPETEG